MGERVAAAIREAGYTPGRPVLRSANLRAGRGELVLLVGASGSGKTTLLLAVTGVIVRLLGGYLRGRARICGANPYTAEGFRAVPRCVGVVLQDPDRQLSMLTPLDEVMFTLENLGYPRAEALERARRVLERFGLKGKELADSARLSGGEKRRLTIAAALVHDPPVLFLDEPTASVDPWGVAEVRRLVREEKGRGRTVIVIEHKARYFLDMADRVIAVRDGSTVREWGRGEASGEELHSCGADARDPVLAGEAPPGGEVLLEARSLAVGYEGRPVVSGVDLELRRGDILAIAGPNGAGKTTLLKALAGLHRPLEGETVYRHGARPFYMPQNPDYMFMFRTVRDELEYSARKGLGAQSLEHLVARDPALAGLLSRSPFRLSHGQRRWLALAIAYLHGARVLLLDEPTTGLDVGLYRELCIRIKQWAERGAVAFSTHDPRLVAECSNRAAVIESGRLREADRGWVLEWMERAWRGA